MQERRKNARIPIKLEVELRRGIWETRLTEDISRRGLFIRMAGTCALRQLLQVRIRLPGETDRLEVMARVTRRESPWAALVGGKLPGVGLEFFCMDDASVARWDRFVSEATALEREAPQLDPFELGRRLAKGDRRPIIPQVDQKTGKVPEQNVSNFIFRVQNLERLSRFMQQELNDGRFGLNLPYEVAPDSPARLRIIHPMSLEEFILQGSVQPNAGAERYVLCFDGQAAGLKDAFQQFISTGIAPVP